VATQKEKKPKTKKLYLLRNRIVDGEPCGPDYEKSTVEVDETTARIWEQQNIACEPGSARAKAHKAELARVAEIQNQDPNAENRDPK